MEIAKNYEEDCAAFRHKQITLLNSTKEGNTEPIGSVFPSLCLSGILNEKSVLTSASFLACSQLDFNWDCSLQTARGIFVK